MAVGVIEPVGVEVGGVVVIVGVCDGVGVVNVPGAVAVNDGVAVLVKTGEGVCVGGTAIPSSLRRAMVV